VEADELRRRLRSGLLLPRVLPPSSMEEKEDRETAMARWIVVAMALGSILCILSALCQW
jgi:hypothetical protein